MGVTRTPHTFIPAVIVNATNGEFLLYRVTVFGAVTGTFTLVDGRNQTLVMSSNDQPSSTNPDFVFQRRWPLPADKVNTSNNYTMGFQFLGVTKYRYEVELHKQGTTQKIFDIEYVPSDDSDSFFEDLDVTTF